MITALVVGTLSQVPVLRTTKNGNSMCTASLAVDVGGGKPAYLGLVAFSEAETLRQLDKGDAVSVRGKLRLNRWTTAEGEARERWEVVADSLLPGPGRPAEARKPKERTSKGGCQLWAVPDTRATTL